MRDLVGFHIADFSKDYVLETDGHLWVAERITCTVRNISNCLTIRTNDDLHSQGLQKYARDRRLWNAEGKLDFG